MKNQHIYHLCKIHTLWIFSYVSQEFPQHCLAPEEQFGDNHQEHVYLARNLIWVPPTPSPWVDFAPYERKSETQDQPTSPLPLSPLSPPELQLAFLIWVYKRQPSHLVCQKYVRKRKGAVKMCMTVLRMHITWKQKCDRHACELWIAENTLFCFKSCNN